MNQQTKLWGTLIIFAIIYSIIAIRNISLAYLDFGDGNYLYISARLADGLMLYRDILAPQPPLHLLVGSGLIRIGRLFSDHPLASIAVVRIFSLIIHIASMFLLVFISKRLFKSELVGLIAAFFYLIIPIGFWWNLCYQSEPLMLIFLLGGFYIMLLWNTKAMIIGGFLHTLAVLTNMTAAPYICWIALIFLIFDRKKFLTYLIPCFGGWLIVVAIFYLMGSDYLGNVFFNQVGTFPKKEILVLNPNGPQNLFEYVVGKVTREGYKIISFDFFFLLWAIIGLIIFIIRGLKKKTIIANQQLDENEKPLFHDKLYILFVSSFTFWTFMSVGFVSKGATMDYIFTIGEPLLCVFAAYAIVSTFHSIILNKEKTNLLRCAITTILFTTILIQIFGIHIKTQNWSFRFAGGQRLLVNTVQQHVFEYTHDGIKGIKSMIQHYSEPGDKIIGPPHYAFVSNRVLAEEYSEIFIWVIKYFNEQIVDKREADGTQKIKSLAAMLRNKEIPIALFDSQLIGIQELRVELDNNYQLRHTFQTLNTPIYVFIPKENSNESSQ